MPLYNQTSSTASVTAAASAAQAAAEAASTPVLAQTAVKTSNYAASANQVVPVDTTSGNVTVTLPNAPAAGTLTAVKQVTRGGTNTVTVACAGSDVFNKAAGATILTLSLLAQGVLLEYGGGVWMVLSDDLPLTQLDARYDAAGAAAAAQAASDPAGSAAAAAAYFLRVFAV